MATEKDPILLYDGDCMLCNSLVSSLNRTNHKIQFIAQQSEAGQRALEHYGLSEISPSSVVYLKNQTCYLKSSASLTLLKDRGGWLKVLYLLIFIPKPMRDFFYDIIAKNRYRIFGKKVVN